MTVQAVKVMGERASATNFLAQLVAENFAVEVIDDEVPMTNAEVRAAERIPEHERYVRQIIERFEDHRHQALMSRAGGWKHACLTHAVFERFQRAGETLFLCILRHPAPWRMTIRNGGQHERTGPN